MNVLIISCIIFFLVTFFPNYFFCSQLFHILFWIGKLPLMSCLVIINRWSCISTTTYLLHSRQFLSLEIIWIHSENLFHVLPVSMYFEPTLSWPNLSISNDSLIICVLSKCDLHELGKEGQWPTTPLLSIFDSFEGILYS